MSETAYTGDRISEVTGFSLEDISALLSDHRDLCTDDGVTLDGFWALTRQAFALASITISVRNKDGAWEVIDRRDNVMVEDFLLAEMTTESLGGDPGQDVLLCLVREDGIELARREVVTRDGG